MLREPPNTISDVALGVIYTPLLQVVIYCFLPYVDGWVRRVEQFQNRRARARPPVHVCHTPLIGGRPLRFSVQTVHNIFSASV